MLRGKLQNSEKSESIGAKILKEITNIFYLILFSHIITVSVASPNAASLM